MQEPKPIGLKNAQLPKMIGQLMHSNQFLKVFSISSLVLVFMVLGVMLVMANQRGQWSSLLAQMEKRLKELFFQKLKIKSVKV
jgi:hypothetical protein